MPLFVRRVINFHEVERDVFYNEEDLARQDNHRDGVNPPNEAVVTPNIFIELL